MTIEQGMNKLAEALGDKATFCIHVEVWNDRDNTYIVTPNDNRVNYKVWDGHKHYEAKSVSKAVNACIDAHRKMRPQKPDNAIKGLENVA